LLTTNLVFFCIALKLNTHTESCHRQSSTTYNV